MRHDLAGLDTSERLGFCCIRKKPMWERSEKHLRGWKSNKNFFYCLSNANLALFTDKLSWISEHQTECQKGFRTLMILRRRWKIIHFKTWLTSPLYLQRVFPLTPSTSNWLNFDKLRAAHEKKSKVLFSSMRNHRISACYGLRDEICWRRTSFESRFELKKKIIKLPSLDATESELFSRLMFTMNPI